MPRGQAAMSALKAIFMSLLLLRNHVGISSPVDPALYHVCGRGLDRRQPRVRSNARRSGPLTRKPLQLHW